MSKKLLGLVRRDQLVALLECGVFDEEERHDDDGSSSAGSPSWTPRPGVGKSPLMHLAYNITDGRYEDGGQSETTAIVSSHRDLLPQEDAYDAHEWLRSIRSTTKLGAAKKQPATLPVGDFMPPMLQLTEGQSVGCVATIATNPKGNVYVSWLNPEYRRKWVYIAAVLNRGTYCVHDHCPVSKAYKLFTALGLRHLIVLGGPSGGEVVGILTRINFLKESIESRTRCKLG